MHVNAPSDVMVGSLGCLVLVFLRNGGQDGGEAVEMGLNDDGEGGRGGWRAKGVRGGREGKRGGGRGEIGGRGENWPVAGSLKLVLL